MSFIIVEIWWCMLKMCSELSFSCQVLNNIRKPWLHNCENIILSINKAFWKLVFILKSYKLLSNNYKYYSLIYILIFQRKQQIATIISENIYQTYKNLKLWIETVNFPQVITSVIYVPLYIFRVAYVSSQQSMAQRFIRSSTRVWRRSLQRRGRWIFKDMHNLWSCLDLWKNVKNWHKYLKS